LAYNPVKTETARLRRALFPSILRANFRSPRLSSSAALLALLALLPGLAFASGARIQVDGRVVAASEEAKNVREALAQAKVTLGEADEVSPALDQPIPADGAIRVSRVKFTEGTLDVKVPYRTVVRAATRGNRPYHPTVTVPGRNGLKRVTYRARLVDGRETERTTVSEVVVREPVHQVVTSRKPQALASRGAYAGQKSMRVLTSAYDPGPGSCGKYANGKTCNGKRAGYGIIAVDPKMIPLGVKLFVPGYGYGIAADVGSAIKGQRVDLGFNSRSGALKWGKKWVTMTIVE
jgi:3D (Asp-Asp-Asp) domain-containing protein